MQFVTLNLQKVIESNPNFTIRPFLSYFFITNYLKIYNQVDTYFVGYIGQAMLYRIINQNLWQGYHRQEHHQSRNIVQCLEPLNQIVQALFMPKSRPIIKNNFDMRLYIIQQIQVKINNYISLTPQQKLLDTQEMYIQTTEPKSLMSSYQYSRFRTFDQNFDRYYTPKPKRMLSLEQTSCSLNAVCSKKQGSFVSSQETFDSTTEKITGLTTHHFEKLQFLGQGKFGQVHLVKHKQTGFICALKVINKNIVRQEKVQEQIIKEIRIHNQLKSLHVIDFYGFFDDETNFYILLEYATQGSVFSKLKGRSRLQQSEIIPIAKGLCDGLRFIHKMGFVHRDIKPQNIVLQFGVPKICDFGWATDCDNEHMKNSYCGTPLYICPQMVKKQFYGTSVDLWAVGLVVYELLVGRGPFSIWNEQDLNQILIKSVQFPEYVDRTQNCESFIRKCLQIQSYKRMQASQCLRHPFLSQAAQSNFDYTFYEQVHQLISNYSNYY